MNEQGKLNLGQVIEKTTLTAGDILATLVNEYKRDPSIANAKILFHFDVSNGNLDCLAWQSDKDVFSIFSNNEDDPRGKDFQVIVKFPLSEEDRKVIAKSIEGLGQNQIKKVNLDKIREEVRAEEEAKK